MLNIYRGVVVPISFALSIFAVFWDAKLIRLSQNGRTSSKSVKAPSQTDEAFVSLLANNSKPATGVRLILDHPVPAPLCSRAQVRNGEWVRVSRTTPAYVPTNHKLRCYPIEDYSSGNWTTWEWEPSDKSCVFTKWSRDLFCSLVKRTTVAIVGDSLSWEQYASLVQLLGLRSRQTYQHESLHQDRNHEQYGCDGTVRLIFRRDDYLHKLDSVFNTSFPQVLVLNRGAHYKNDSMVLQDLPAVDRALFDWKSRCEGLGIKCHLIYRTTVPGHPQCSKFVRPSKSIEEMESIIRNRSSYETERKWGYHWYDFQHQNEMILNRLSHHLGELNVLDAYYINVLRPDEHRANQGDCLHSCYPGKMDVYNQVMLHYLQMIGGVQPPAFVYEELHKRGVS